MIDNNHYYENFGMDRIIEEKDEEGEGGGRGRGERENDEDLSDIRLVVGLNYFKLEAPPQQQRQQPKRIYFLPCDLTFKLFDWKNMNEEVLMNGYESLFNFSTLYENTTDSSLTDIKEKVNEIEEKQIISSLKLLINDYRIKHVYVYGNNNIIRRLFENLNVNVYNIKDISPSCTPTPIDLGRNRKYNSNLKKNHQTYDHYFKQINDVVMKISRIFVLGYNPERMCLSWEHINGCNAFQTFIGREKTVVEIKNYINSKELCRMNIFSLALLRRVLEKDMACKSLDIVTKAKTVSYLLKIILLCFVKPNYFKWAEINSTTNDVSKDFLTFTITGPRKIYPVMYNSSLNYSCTMYEELETFIDAQMENEDSSKDQIMYENNNLPQNLSKFINAEMF